MTDPAPIPDRQPSPGVQPPPLSLPTPVAEASNNPIEAEPLPPVHEEDEQLQHQHEHGHHQLLPELQPQQPPPFQPLFTLVTDSTTRATHHPRVHYIFSDDDPEILTEALAHYGPQKQNTLSSPSGSGTTLEARDRPRQPSTASITTPNNERVIILDLVPKATNTTAATATTTTATAAHSDEHSAAAATASSAGGGGGGYDVAWASSLSSDWAVVSARISPMADDINASSTGAGPSAAGDPDGENNPQQQQLILRIEGLGLDAVAPSRAPGTRARRSSTATATGAGAAGRRPSIEERGDLRMSGSSGAAPQGQGQGQERGREDYAAIMDEFDRRMGVLRKVVDAGMERQRRLAADEEDTAPEGLPSGTHTHDWGLEQGGVGGSFVQQQQRQGRAVSAASMRPSEGGE
ncbi:hypothetical protein VSDG_05143 [Cytospora chrysosperma]|uniref:Uncharacterized protein n=1 Tax=Cytospora chrysosperma TaxID=252740 RepID=A0A423VXV5_CYTCH|nr:hypothetical protein VSDG_05143 [Valsa sordida]